MTGTTAAEATAGTEAAAVELVWAFLLPARLPAAMATRAAGDNKARMIVTVISFFMMLFFLWFYFRFRIYVIKLLFCRTIGFALRSLIVGGWRSAWIFFVIGNDWPL